VGWVIHKNMVGKMDKRISILREYQADDGHNGKVSTFTGICDLWSYIFIGSGTENYKFGRVFGKDNYVFVVRNVKDFEIRLNDVVDYCGERMNITHITKIDGRDLYMAIEAEKGVGV
jgi:head-tail adaptor